MRMMRKILRARVFLWTKPLCHILLLTGNLIRPPARASCHACRRSQAQQTPHPRVSVDKDLSHIHYLRITLSRKPSRYLSVCFPFPPTRWVTFVGTLYRAGCAYFVGRVSRGSDAHLRYLCSAPWYLRTGCVVGNSFAAPVARQCFLETRVIGLPMNIIKSLSCAQWQVGRL